MPNLFLLAPLVEPSGDLQNFKSDVVPATLSVPTSGPNDLDCSGICFPALMSRVKVCGRALGYRCSNTSATVRQVLTKAHS